MSHQIAIQYPDSLALTLRMNDTEFKQELKTISIIKLYEMGRVSSGYAAKLLNISRLDFIDLLEQYEVSYFHKGLEDELINDFDNA